jgi:hypothetical protein
MFIQESLLNISTVTDGIVYVSSYRSDTDCHSYNLTHTQSIVIDVTHRHG